MEPTVKGELKKFGETVSVKGVSRILKARSITIRTLWLIAVLTCFGVLIWQVTSVLKDYFKHTTDSSYKEGKNESQFPDITICQLTKSVDDFSTGINLTYADYKSIVEKKKQEYPFKVMHDLTGIDESLYSTLWPAMLSPNGYFYVTSRDKKSLHAEDLIRAHMHKAWESDSDESDYPSYIETFWDESFGKCCTIQLNSSSDRSEVEGLSAILFINNFGSTMSKPFVLNPSRSQGKGVRVIVHAPGTRPHPIDGIDVGPGTQTTIGLRNTIRQRVPYPYGGCTKEKHVDALDDTSVPYTVDDCYDFCIQQNIIDHCNCIDNTKYFSQRQLSLVNGNICGKKTPIEDAGVEDFFNLACMLDYRDFTDSCQDECQTPCMEHLYDLGISSVPWPHPAVQMSFYEDYIADNGEFFGKGFDDYALLFANESLSDEETCKMLQNMHGLEENFIQLNVLINNFRPMLLTDKPSITADKMLSLIGGSLSFWLGVTVMTLVEFVQFLFDLVLAMHSRRNVASISVKA